MKAILESPFRRNTSQALVLTATTGLVLLFQWLHLSGLETAKDLPLWDESAYIGWGDEFLQDGKVGSITNAPFYHVLYGAVIRAVGLLPSFYAMQYALKLTLPVLVAVLVHGLSRSAAFSLLVGLFFSYSHYHLNAEVLVYYSGLIPFLAAILTARHSPMLSLGFSVLAGLGRLEYLAVAVIHLTWLVWERVRGARRRGKNGAAAQAGTGGCVSSGRAGDSPDLDAGAKDRGAGMRASAHARAWRGLRLPGHFRTRTLRRLMVVGSTAAVWALNVFVLTRITVWQFHNRVWFAWSQNYAAFRYLTRRDSGGNPWLDHQLIAERDFPGAHSLSEAILVNPAGVLDHTWFNLRQLPGYLAEFAVTDPHFVASPTSPIWVLSAIGCAGMIGWAARRRRLRSHDGALSGSAAANSAAGLAASETIAESNGGSTREVPFSRRCRVEIVLCLGGVIAAAPGLLVSSKTNYIMPLLPGALLLLSWAHVAATRLKYYRQYAPVALIAVSVLFAMTALGSPATYPSQGSSRPVYEDVITLRRTLPPLRGLKILGVSSTSFVNYLGRENGYVFVEPLAISPVNRQAPDLSLAALVARHDPDVLLINSQWRASRTFSEAIAGFRFEGWNRHPLRDGELYLRQGVLLEPSFRSGWYSEEAAGGDNWRWSEGTASITVENRRANRAIDLQCSLRSVAPRVVEIRINGRWRASVELPAHEWREIAISGQQLSAGTNRLEFRSIRPAVHVPGDDRALAFCVQNLVMRDATETRARERKR